MSLVDTIAAAERLSISLGRDDILEALKRIRRRLERDVLTVAVVGDFKQGKTSLVNGLLGQPVLPVDADLATAVPTLVRAGATSITVHRSDDGNASGGAVAVDAIVDWVSEHGNPGNREQIDLVEVTLENPLLAAGVALVDTPGLGGLNAAQRAATLHLLAKADALVFVTDASSPLSRIEVEFLRTAAEFVPFGLVVVSRIDLHSQWRRMIEEIERTFQTEEIGLAVIGVSSFLREEALREQDTVLNDESGFPELLARLSALKSRRTELVSQRVAAEAGKTLEILARDLEEPGGADPAAGLELAKQHQLALASAAGRIPGMLQDAFADLRSAAEFATRAALRSFSNLADTRIDEVDPANEWSGVIEEAMAALTADLGAVLDLIDHHAIEAAGRLATLIGEESGLGHLLSGAGEPSGLPVAEVDDLKFDRPSILGTGFQTLRGAQSGLILLGMVAKLSGLAALLPVSLGVGLVFGVKQLGDERKRQLEKRRQEARKAIRVLVAESSAEATRLVQDQIRERHRVVRDHLQEQTELAQRSAVGALRRAEQRVALAGAEKPMESNPADLLDELRQELRAAAGP